MPAHRTARPRGTGSLTERQNADGTRSWVAQWRDANGTPRKKTLGRIRERGSEIGLDRKQAEDELRDLLQASRPADHRVVPQTVRLSVTGVAGLIMNEQRLEGRTENTIDSFERLVRCHLEPFFGTGSLAAIERGDVNRLMTHLIAQGKAPSTAVKVRGALAQICNYAIREGWLARNPVAGAILPKAPDEDNDGEARLRFLSVEELYQLAEHGPQDDALGRAVDGDLYLVAGMTGMRLSELRGLTWQHIQFEEDGGRIRVWLQLNSVGKLVPTKGKRKRVVPMGDAVARVLAKRALAFPGGSPSPSALVFTDPDTGQWLTRRRLSGDRFTRACQRAGVPVITFHELRHSFGTTMARNGCDVVTLQGYMGHKHVTTTQIYMHFAPDPDGAKRITAAFARKVSESAHAELAG